MKAGDRPRQLLRWYPEAWRQRYGDELLVMIDDTMGDRRPTFRFRWNIAWAGLRERGHSAGLLGAPSDQPQQVRAGALLVLCSWSAFVVAGATFEKQSEHFARSVPANTRSLVSSAYDVVALTGIVGSLAVLLGALVILPSFLAYMRSGGWGHLRRPLMVAGALTLATLGGVLGLVGWAHGLSVDQRNGGDGLYSMAFAVVALVLMASIVQWTVVAVVAVRRMTLSSGVLRMEAILAYAVTLAMVVITAGVALWWGVMGFAAPRFFQGAAGSSSLALTPHLVGLMVLMLVATPLSLFGSARILHGWQRI